LQHIGLDSSVYLRPRFKKNSELVFKKMKRFFDFLLAIVLILIFSIPLLLLCLLVRLTSKGSALYWSDRVGRHNHIFKMAKLRTMKVDSPVVATHLLSNPQSLLTPVGSFLRKSSLDELPQLWNIFIGDMSFVGPRPALFNQHDLIELRALKGLDELRPGLTGWAQVNGRDELAIPEKVKLDEAYLHQQSFLFDMKILYLTFLKVVRQDDVTH